MSGKSWQVSLAEALNRLPEADRLSRVAVIGIGHPLCGDDAAGIKLAEALQPLVADCETVLVLNAGPAPESFGGQIRRFKPDLVLLVDAAQMMAAPGAVRWLDWRETTGIGASTHTLPLHLFARYLTLELGCEVALLGLQPAQNAVGAPLSPLVQATVEQTARALAVALIEHLRRCASTRPSAP